MFPLQASKGMRDVLPAPREGNLSAPRVGRQPLELSDRPDGGGREEDFSPPTGSLRLPQNVAISRTTRFGSWFSAFTSICSSFVSMVSLSSLFLDTMSPKNITSISVRLTLLPALQTYVSY